MSSEVGNGHVAIFPTFSGFRSAVTRETDGAAQAGAKGFARAFNGAGSKAGQSTGRGFKGAFDAATHGVGSAALKKLQADATAAAKVVSTSRLKEQDATGKLRVAEAQLVEVRSKYAAGSARLIAAEEKVASAQRAVASAQENTKDASTRLSAAQSKVRAATEQAGAAVSRSVGGFRAAGVAMRGLHVAGLGLAKLFSAGLGLGLGLAAVRALGSGVRRLTRYIGASISTAAQWQTLNAQTAAVIKSTGGAAQVTSGHIGALSQRLENQTATEAEAIQKGANLLLTFTGIRNEAGKGNKVFDQTTAIAVDMAKALGIDVSQAALQLGKALNDPSKGLTALTRSGVTFTDQQKNQIKTLVASGHTLEAQKVILRELNKEFGGSGAAYANTYAGALYRIQDAAGDFGASIASAALPAITKLLGTGADLINWAAGTNVVQEATAKIASGVGRIADKVLTFSKSLKGKNPLEGLFKAALPKVDFGQFTAGLQSALGVAKPLLDAFFAYLRNIGPGVGATLSVIGPALAGVFTQIGPALQQTLPLLGQAVVQLLPSAVQVLQALIPLLPPVAQVITNLAPVVSVLAGVLSFLITNGLRPLVQATADAGRAATALASGLNPMQVALQGAAGKFGPVIQAASQFSFAIGSTIHSVVGFFIGLAVNVGGALGRFAAAISSGVQRALAFFGRIGQIPGIAIRAIGSFVGIIVSGVGRAAGAVASGISRAVAFVGRLGQIPGIAARAIGSFVSSLAGGFGRAVAAASSGVGRVIGQVRTLPGRVAGAIGNLGSALYSSGRALIDGFARGIRDAIGAAVAAAKAAVSAVAKFFPHSPAPEGPFSGRGYTTFSGLALTRDFASSIESQAPRVSRAAGTVMQAAARQFASTSGVVTSSTAAAGAASAKGERPIYADGLGLIGWMQDVANGEAQIVWNQQNSRLSSAARLASGARTRQRLVFP